MQCLSFDSFDIWIESILSYSSVDSRDDGISTVWVDFSIPSIIPYRMFIRVRENYRENQTLHALKEKLRTVKRKYGKLIHEQKSEIFLSK